MTFKIKQNDEFVTLNSFDEQFCAFTGAELRSDEYGCWFIMLDRIFNTWGDIADNTDKKYSYLRKKMNIKDSRAIPANDAAHCLMLWATLSSSSDMDDALSRLKYVKPFVDFCNSLENTTFYFSF